MPKAISRRDFIKKSAASAALFSILPSWAAGRARGPSETLNVAVIGPGGRGTEAVNRALQFDGARIVAMCDADFGRAADSFSKAPEAAKFHDYREMFDKMGRDIDAVFVATPDHAHYPAASWAMANGKHTYVEKPLARTVWETRELKRIAKKTGLITQMGNQGHAGDGWRKVREWHQAGLLGDIVEIHHWTDRPVPEWWAQGALKRPSGAESAPEGLDWKLWLNVAPDQPYSKMIMPFKWRGMRDFGTSSLGDMGCHFLDLGYSAFGLGAPLKVSGKPSEFNDFSWPQECSVTYEFAPLKPGGENIRLYWYDFKNRPRDVRGVPQETIEKNANGSIIVGTKNTVFCNNPYGGGVRISPDSRMKSMMADRAFPEPSIPRPNPSPHVEWMEACLKGIQPGSNIADFSADFTEVVLLGLASNFFPGETLEYDSAAMRFKNRPEADKFLRSLYPYKEEFLPGKI